MTGTNEDNQNNSSNSCKWHWLILLVAFLGLVTTVILGRKKKTYLFISTAASIILNLILAIIGTCSLDWVFMIVGAVLVIALDVVIFNKQKNKQVS